jgi:flotillin
MAVVPALVSPERERERLREHGGWRSGKPVEDPDKLKPWGFVTARPSEYLVHVRRGRVLTRTSGQGATCFKWPWDAVAIVPTSLQRLQFCADQVTAERVGVEVVGLAVYRIAEPLLAYRVLNFSFPERAQEKLEETLTAMFIGAARRLIANLSVDDCLQKRKSALATELLRETAPVVGGKGALSDGTASGWGVVIDTIEIQEVRVLSQKVFADMQAPYRSALEQRAREAKASAEKEVQTREAEYRRATEEARIHAETAILEKKREAEQVAVEAVAQLAMRRAALQAEQGQTEIVARRRVQEAEFAAQQAEDDRHAQASLRELERQQVQAHAEIAAHEARAQAALAAGQLERGQARLEAELVGIRAEARRAEGAAAAEVDWRRAQIESERLMAQARLVQAEKLPELAAAIGSRIGEVRIAQYGGDSNPFASITQAVSAVLDLVRDPAAKT